MAPPAPAHGDRHPEPSLTTGNVPAGREPAGPVRHRHVDRLSRRGQRGPDGSPRRWEVRAGPAAAGLPPETWLEAQQATKLVPVAPGVAEYAVEICRASRIAPGVLLGASPRAVIWLIRSAQAHAVLSSRRYVVPADVRRSPSAAWPTASCWTTAKRASGRRRTSSRTFLKRRRRRDHESTGTTEPQRGPGRRRDRHSGHLVAGGAQRRVRVGAGDGRRGVRDALHRDPRPGGRSHLRQDPIVSAPVDCIAGTPADIRFAASTRLRVCRASPFEGEDFVGPVGRRRAPDARRAARAGRRGVHDFVTLDIATAAPFALQWWTRRVVLPLPSTLHVAPRGGRPESFPLRAHDDTGAAIDWVQTDAGQPRGARPYQPGDSRRRVHWSATAHAGELMVRELERPSAEPVTLTVVLPRTRRRRTGSPSGPWARSRACSNVVPRCSSPRWRRRDRSRASVADRRGAGRRLARAVASTTATAPGPRVRTLEAIKRANRPGPPDTRSGCGRPASSPSPRRSRPVRRWGRCPTRPASVPLAWLHSGWSSPTSPGATRRGG